MLAPPQRGRAPQFEKYYLNQIYHVIEIHLSGFEVPCYDPSRSHLGGIVRPPPRLFTAPILVDSTSTTNLKTSELPVAVHLYKYLNFTLDDHR
ncbi:hypothetical protein TNCV_3588421 [Trichonephila clavipes]|nr:hypothetical protein TNCV_3588421 [Trichonephila clavipes]